MPKGNEIYPDRLDLFVTHEMRQTVEAVSYHMGAKGARSTAVRMLLDLGIAQYMEGLTARQRTDYDFIESRIALIDGPQDAKKLKI